MATFFRSSVVLLIICSVCCFLYGIYNIGIEIEPNACRMTYMFGQPMFARIKVAANDEFANYGLYYYYENYRQMEMSSIKLTGAPVIFVPGNAGSYKQVRSLASVALRKGMHNEQGIHLDYFTIDFNEELSGFYGGYLLSQQQFLKHCIKAVLHFYKGNSKVVLIGHSMGGKLAQSILIDPQTAKHINTIISISSPMDAPVLNLDGQIADFYSRTNVELENLRTAVIPNAETNICVNTLHTTRYMQLNQQNYSAKLDNILLISTGGGNRDLLVRAGLTTSQFTDIHVMTSAMPKVGLSCDHLSAVWCLQFMLVINRFLFHITHVDKNYVVKFNEDKQKNLLIAMHHFVKPRYWQQNQKLRFHGSATIDDHKLVFNKRFPVLTTAYNQLIKLSRPEKIKKLFIGVINVVEHNWLYGCVARKNSAGGVNCSNGTSLAHYIQYSALELEKYRSYALLDLNSLRKTYTNWTHILVQLPATSAYSGFNIDFHDPKERTIDLKLPVWYSLKPRPIVNETIQDSIRYNLRFAGIMDPFQAIRVDIDPLACKNSSYHISMRLCVPWSAGFQRTYIINQSSSQRYVYLNVPNLIPRGYNTTTNPIILEILLDPVCRYKISYQYSMANSMARLVQEFYGWMPAHFIAVLLIVLKNQLSAFEVRHTFKSLRPYTGFFQFTSIYVVTGCRVFRKVLTTFKRLPPPEQLNYSIYISVIIHSCAILISIIASFAIWTMLTLHGRVIYNIAYRLMRMPQSLSNVLTSINTHLPITFGVLTIALAIGTCSGVGLLFASTFYFLMLSNAYKEYIEDMLWQKAVHLINSTGQKLGVLDPGNNDSLDGTQSANNTDSDNENKIMESDKAKTQKSDEDVEKCFGLHNFPFHITIFLVILMLSVLNFPPTIAWMRAKGLGLRWPDPALFPTILALSSLTVLLQVKAPNELFSASYNVLTVILYFCAASCLLYCQVALYRLNYIISIVLAILALHELVLGKFIHYNQQYQ